MDGIYPDDNNALFRQAISKDLGSCRPFSILEFHVISQLLTSFYTENVLWALWPQEICIFAKYCGFNAQISENRNLKLELWG